MLFDDLLHNSPSNLTAFPRLSFAARYARTDFASAHNHLAGYGCVMVSGHNRDSGLRLLPPPDSGPGLASIASSL